MRSCDGQVLPELLGMRILITGAGGFVAPYIAEALRKAAGDRCEIVLGVRDAREAAAHNAHVLDLEDAPAIAARIADIAPTHIVHLAAVSSPPSAGADPDLAWRVNVGGTLAIARAIRTSVPDCVLLFAGSGQVYGETAQLDRAMTEADVLAPMSDYAVTKAAADLALGALAGQGLRCIRFRPFNHTGAGQTEDFVLPSFAAQIARIEAGKAKPVIRVGNLEAERDFLDVRDVADAYARAALRSDALKPGTVLNIASGQPRRVGDLLDALLALSDVAITVEQDQARMRPSDTPRFFGDASRARELLDWTPRLTMRDTLRDLLAAARKAARG
jgi:GDP-4-dehydro-6-deoxy-D-mannose reductase